MPPRPPSVGLPPVHFSVQRVSISHVISFTCLLLLLLLSLPSSLFPPSPNNDDVDVAAASTCRLTLRLITLPTLITRAPHLLPHLFVSI